MDNNSASLYWIHLPEHTDPKSQGYIGVSKTIDQRFKYHLAEAVKESHPNTHLANAIKKYGWENLVKDILLVDNEEICYLKEEEFRPSPNIGWNLSPGGHRGPGRDKGSKNSKSSIEKAKETIRLRKIRIETGNLTDDDIEFLQRKKERALLSQQKRDAEKKKRIKEKEEKKKKKLEEIEKIRKEKNRKRTQGVKLKEQPNRPFCKNCKTSLAKPNGKSIHGFQKWHKYCVDCSKAAYNPKFGYLLNKKNYCEECNFVAADKCQLDVIYKDGNRKNKDNSNLKTICANCNRLLQKTLKKTKKSVLDITVDADVTI